jgi:hypothetical protein
MPRHNLGKARDAVEAFQAFNFCIQSRSMGTGIAPCAAPPAEIKRQDMSWPAEPSYTAANVFS